MARCVLDYELEEWLRSQKAPGCPECPKLTWQNRVQYAVSYAINDYYTLEPAVRLHTPIQVLLNRRWPRNKDDFPDPLHYWKVYNDIVGQLIRISEPDIYEHPIALYEKWDTQVAELDLHLSVIFQTVWQRSKDQKPWITVQKFLVEDHPELVKAFTHMANVFWNSAFGGPPDQIEVFALLDDRKYTITKERLDLNQSLDYVYLLAETAGERPFFASQA